MSRLKKIILCAVFLTALLFCLAFSSFAANPYRTYKVTSSSSLYSGMTLKVTQYVQNAPEHTTPWVGLSVSKTFTPDDGQVNYVPSNGNYEINFYPFRTDWYDSSGVVFNDGGEFEYDISIPYTDSNGNLFDLEKLNDSAYIDQIALYFNSFIVNSKGYVNKRGFTVYIELANGGKVFLKQDNNSTVSSQDFSIVTKANIKASDIVSFHFQFKYYGLPNPDSLFQFTIDADSYIIVFDKSIYEDNIINSNNNSIANVQSQVGSLVGDLDTPKPNENDVNSALDNIDIGAVDSFGSLVGVNSSSHVNFQRFIIAIIGSVSGVAFIGYVLHGKRG